MVTKNQVVSAIACNLDQHLLQSAWPLLKRGEVEAIEWSFDTLFQAPSIPDWFHHLLTAYSDQGRLIGHGVYFSLFSGRFLAEQKKWLIQLNELSKTYRFDHVTEHFGFMTGRDFHHGAPMSVPFTPTTLRIGIDRLQRLQAACQCPVGLENLAYAPSIHAVHAQGDFLQQLLEPVDGFIILDLHNIFCQMCNFDWTWAEVKAAYPLERVREIHISGGSWQENPDPSSPDIRRDTHDEAVPEAVFNLLANTLPNCPNVKFVVLEQIGFSLATSISQQTFRSDFHRMKSIVDKHNRESVHAPTSAFNGFSSFHHALSSPPAEDESLYAEQLVLSEILESAQDKHSAARRLKQSILANTAWHIEQWDLEMIETARLISQKWKDGFHAYATSKSVQDSPV